MAVGGNVYSFRAAGTDIKPILLLTRNRSKSRVNTGVLIH